MCRPNSFASLSSKTFHGAYLDPGFQKFVIWSLQALVYYHTLTSEILPVKKSRCSGLDIFHSEVLNE